MTPDEKDEAIEQLKLRIQLLKDAMVGFIKLKDDQISTLEDQIRHESGQCASYKLQLERADRANEYLKERLGIFERNLSFAFF